MARILIVDDEDCILRTTAILLESVGHSTVCVFNGREALNQLDVADFDLMLTDIRMLPVDGMELIRLSGSRKPKMPIIVISAYCSDQTEQAALKAGAIKYIRKPFKVDEVLDAVKDVLSTSGKK